MRFEPIPTAATPALNQAVMLSRVSLTPPVGMMRVHGQGPRMDLTNSGPPTESPGNTLTISTPSSSACAISEAEPQPGLYGILRRLHSRATSGLRFGPTTKLV